MTESAKKDLPEACMCGNLYIQEGQLSDLLRKAGYPIPEGAEVEISIDPKDAPLSIHIQWTFSVRPME